MPPASNVIPMTSPPISRSGSTHPHSQPTNLVHQQVPLQQTSYSQPQPPVVSNGSQSRFLTSISPAPGANARSAQSLLHIPAYSSSTPEPQHGANNRNSLYGSPLLVANIPLPPGAHNPLIQSPVSYQPHSQYQPHALSAGSVPGGNGISPTHALPHAGSLHSVPTLSSSGPSSLTAAAAGALPRPLSQQAFLSSPPHSGGSANGSGQNFINELSMYSGTSATGTSTIRGLNSKGSQPQQVRQNSQPQPAQQQRPIHPRQINSIENRSSSAEELRGDPNKSGVKSFMKGMNAKFTEIRKAGL